MQCLLKIAMNTEPFRMDDESLSTIHASKYITWNEFIEINGLDRSKIMNDPKYRQLALNALAMANYTQGAAEAASRLKP
jgi:hypothetical protein